MADEQPEGDGRKSVEFRVRVWVDEDDRRIRLFSDEAEIRTTISENPEHDRGHAHLYAHLRRVLEQAGKWPDGL